MQQPKVTLAIALFFIGIFLIFNSTVVVKESDQVILTQFGAPVGEALVEPGLYFKLPFVQEATRFEKRFLAWDGSPNEIPTLDKRYIWVDTYARWRISDPLRFFQRVRNEAGAQSRLDDILDGETRSVLSRHNLADVVRSSNRILEVLSDSVAQAARMDAEESAKVVRINVGRDSIAQQILANASPRTLELGIELLDVQFKRLNYTDRVRSKIFERMITERRRIADRFRSEGQGEASRIRGDRERDLKEIQSGAYRQAQQIKGAADSAATAIYAAAYDKNADSREFYGFLKSLETYEAVLGKDDWVVLSTKNGLFKYLENMKGK